MLDNETLGNDENLYMLRPCKDSVASNCQMYSEIIFLYCASI